MKGATEAIVGILPLLQRASVAVDHMREVGVRFDANRDVGEPWSVSKMGPFEYVRLSEIAFEYDAVNGEKPFRLGPISLDIHCGEIILFHGGNGSGKTSFLKLLCGLYVPAQGFIVVDGKTIGTEERNSYRQMFSGVFQDFFLLKKAPVLWNPDVRERAQAYLHEFGLGEQVRIVEEEFVCRQLSRGQQKRLALILAIIEDKPIYIFDEWAADQDSNFRAYFYDVILPRLKTERKTVVAVTHDDIYFRSADRVILLRDGIIVNGSVSSVGPFESVGADCWTDS
jgi:putative pyoverdin transport system ATP-binding/permease protein